MKTICLRLGSMIVCISAVILFAPVFVNATEGLCEHHAEHIAECNYSADAGNGCIYVCNVCEIASISGGNDESMAAVQALIDALLDVVTAENAEGTVAQLTVIDQAALSLSDDQKIQLDLTRYSAVATALGSYQAAQETAKGQVLDAYEDISDGTYDLPVRIHEDVNVYGGTFNASTTNDGVIHTGIFNGTVTNTNIIHNGTFSSLVGNYSAINNGTFSHGVTNKSLGSLTGVINDGVFTGAVDNESIINGGVYANLKSNTGTINGGYFSANCDLSGNVDFSSIVRITKIKSGGDGTVQIVKNGIGIEYGQVGGTCTVVVEGELDGLYLLSDPNAALAGDAEISSVFRTLEEGRNYEFTIPGNNVTVYAVFAKSNPETAKGEVLEATEDIYGGTFNLPVRIHDGVNVHGGTFNVNVSNAGMIHTGTFNSSISNSNVINGGTFTSLVGNYEVINGGLFTYQISNNLFEGSAAVINGGVFTGTVENEGIINSGTYANLKSNTGTINGGYFAAGSALTGNVKWENLSVISKSTSGGNGSIRIEKNGVEIMYGQVGGTCTAVINGDPLGLYLLDTGETLPVGNYEITSDFHALGTGKYEFTIPRQDVTVLAVFRTEKPGETMPFVNPCANGHSYGEYISDNNATCSSDGTKTAVCQICGDKQTVTDAGSRNEHNYENSKCTVCGMDESVPTTPSVDACANGHSYGEYISDNNATCSSDGTKTAVCQICGDKQTVTDAGSRKEHNYENGKCTICSLDINNPSTGDRISVSVHVLACCVMALGYLVLHNVKKQHFYKSRQNH